MIRTRLPLLTLCLALLAGCATLPSGSKRDVRDPWERMNRATYRFNDTFDRALARPVARGYRAVTPGFVQTGIRNFFDNVDTPIVMLNDLLQGQFKAFANDTGRLLLNTTLGLGGLLDPATPAGLERNDRDFGQTLGKWGMRKGPYLVLPFLGPSDVRDGVGRIGDTYSTPRTYVRSRPWRWGLWTLDIVDTRARLLDTTRLLDSAFDPYAFLRNAYLQRRDFMVNGAQADDHDEQALMDEAADEPAPAAPAAAPVTPATAPPAQSAPPQTEPPPPQ